MFSSADNLYAFALITEVVISQSKGDMTQNITNEYFGDLLKLKAIVQVKNSIADIDNATQQNAAMVKNSISSSTSLKEQARSLKQLMSFFKINK